MDCSAQVMQLLDFDGGECFEEKLFRSTGRYVHDTRSLDRNNFLPLATFRRRLFQLNDETVALALHSCLGGLVSHFQVSYQSYNHFCFSVSCKAVGFEIYKLRRFIGRSFGVYFHLWSNGAPHWEKEKGLWEAEEAKLWTKVVSKRQKKDAKSVAAKSVKFAP